jgi:hypothetical protein
MKNKHEGYRSSKLIVSLALAVALLWPSEQALKAATEQAPPPAATSPGKDVIGCIEVGVIIGIGVAGIYIIWRLCKLLPPAPPATPPPPPPVVPTNAPPIVTNSPPPIIVARPAFTLLDVPMPPPYTNGPASTNAPTPAKPYYWLPNAWLTNAVSLMTQFSDTNGYDVSSLGYYDTNGASPSLIKSYLWGDVESFQSSTNLIDWANYKFQAWLSGSGLITVLSDGQGAPILTNYSAAGPFGATNNVPVAIWVGREQMKFHRFKAQ